MFGPDIERYKTELEQVKGEIIVGDPAFRQTVDYRYGHFRLHQIADRLEKLYQNQDHIKHAPNPQGFVQDRAMKLRQLMAQLYEATALITGVTHVKDPVETEANLRLFARHGLLKD